MTVYFSFIFQFLFDKFINLIRDKTATVMSAMIPAPQKAEHLQVKFCVVLL